MSVDQSRAHDIPAQPIAFQALESRQVTTIDCDQSRYGCPVEALRGALAREAALLMEKDAMLQEQDILRSESDHRLLNGMQMVVSLLSLQGRASTNPDVAAIVRCRQSGGHD